MRLACIRWASRGLLLCGLASPVAAGQTPNWNEDTLTGDWSGVRSDWTRRALILELALKVDVLSNVSGGLKRGTEYMDNWDVKLRADAEKLLGWTDTAAYLHVISNHGGKLNADHVGSFMGVDNIEVATHTTRAFHAWLERGFLDGNFSFLGGLYPIDSEFYVTDATAVFLHPTGGMAAEVAQTGANGPSIFPISSFGFRARWRPSANSYWQAAVVDGVPGNRNKPRGTHIRFDRGDGTLMIVEAGMHPSGKDGSISKYAAGYWRYTPRFDDLVETDALGNPVRRVNRGAYVLAEQTVYAEKNDASQGLTLFFRYGVASEQLNTLDRSYSLGLRYKGIFPGRDEDELGVGMARAHAGASFRQAARVSLEAYETALEVTYRAKVAPWLAVQPVLQHIRNPGHDPALRSAWLAGARVEVAF